MISFDAPFVLYASPIVAVVIGGLAIWARSARVRRAAVWSREMGAISARVGRGGVIALGVTALLAGVALSGPRFGRRVVTTETKALALVVAVDISRSMLAEDVAPSRLGRVKQEVRRLIQDLGGDRIGLIAFAGRSFILSPLTVDDGALQLLVEGLDPDIASAGGTELAPVLDQAWQLLSAGPAVADRVLVLFTDGETHDSLPAVLAAARRLRREGVHLILVGEGEVDGARIPLRDPAGVLTGYQEDLDGNVVRTSRRDDILSAIADAAQGALVPARLGDQAGAVRDLVNSYKRAPQTTTTAAEDISRAWIPLLIAVAILLVQTFTRRTAALAAIAFLLLAPAGANAQGRPNPADEAWRLGAYGIAADLYQQQVLAGQGGDTALLNLGTAALALGDTARAVPALAGAARSLEPELRYRALFNLGLLSLQLAAADPANEESHLTDARRLYREALLLRPEAEDAKWNYELAVRQAPPGDGGSPPPPQNPGDGENDPQPDPQAQGLTREQAEQILNSMLAEEAATRDRVNRRRTQPTGRRRKNW